MCGITGFIDYNKSTTLESLRKMTDVMELRGPDGAGYELLKKNEFHVGLGHRRLSIIDLSTAGSQPMFFDNLAITYNGEVYNFKEIRTLLKKSGHTFSSDSDTEVILHAFREWGPECVHYFRGMFSFCIYDQQKEKIYLFRDRIGVKPLYYYHSQGLFLFGSTVYALQAHPKFVRDIDPLALNLYFQYGYIRAPYSIYKDVKKVMPGHYIVLDLRTNILQENSYWNLAKYFYTEKSDISYHEATEALEEILLESFQLRMVADVDVGLFLSGGIDSSLVTTLLQLRESKKIKTFTIGFQEDTFNEATYAKAIATRLGTDHTEFICQANDARDIIAQMPEIYDEPFSAVSGLATHLIAKVARKQVKVVLSGDGGDETFCGYTSYSLNLRRFNQLQKLPLRKSIASIWNHNDLLSSIVNPNTSRGTRLNRIRTILGNDGYPQMHMLSSSIFTPFDLKKLLKVPYTDQPDFSKVKLDLIAPVEQLMLADVYGYLPDEILVKVDRATMGVSLESREPLLDQKILEYAAALPIKYKQEKRILKSILGKYLPNDLYDRKKQGFGLPINSWLRSELRPLVQYYLSEEKISKTKFLNYSYVHQLKKDFFNTKNQDYRIWSILMFQMWYEKNL